MFTEPGRIRQLDSPAHTGHAALVGHRRTDRRTDHRPACFTTSRSPSVLCYLVVGASVISNVVATFVYPANKRLSETETLLIVLFDMLQLGLMLYLTGGLNNPFSILIVGPVTVSASALSSRSTLFLGISAILMASVLIEFHLAAQNGANRLFHLRVPQLFLFGNWVAIVIAVVFLGVYSRRIVSEMHAMSLKHFRPHRWRLAREQKLTDLGGVVAAAAHELGTPLATIKLTSSELAEELVGKRGTARGCGPDPANRPTVAATSCGPWGAPARTIFICARRPSRP